MARDVIPVSIDCSAVSQLPSLFDSSEKLSSESLMLVSQPHPTTDTGYISKYATLSDLTDYLSGSLSVYDIWSELDKKVDKAFLSTTGTLSADCETPYIISSFEVISSLLDPSSIKGYRLSAGMQIELGRCHFEHYSAAVHHLCVLDELSVDPKILPHQLSTHLIYDNGSNKLILTNRDKTIYSEVDRDQILSDFVDDQLLSAVSLSKDGTKLYLYFKIGNPPQAKKITVRLSAIVSLYDYVDGLSVMREMSEEAGKPSVYVDLPYMARHQKLSGVAFDDTSFVTTYDTYVQAIGKLEARLRQLESRVLSSGYVMIEDGNKQQGYIDLDDIDDIIDEDGDSMLSAELLEVNGKLLSVNNVEFLRLRGSKASKDDGTIDLDDIDDIIDEDGNSIASADLLEANSQLLSVNNVEFIRLKR